MDLHPLFVHFPIGILILYALSELIPASVHKNITGWTNTKAFLSITGVLAALVTLVTGGIAASLVTPGSSTAQIVEVHEHMALLTTLIFFVLGGSYLIRIFEVTGDGDKIASRLGSFVVTMWHLKEKVAHWVLDTPLRPILALAGLVSITLTAGLGASMVYGPDFDPFVRIIYNIFF
jgi:uncharacterized membrane protein